MPQPDRSTQALIRRLTVGTREGKVDWKPDSATSFKVKTASGEISIHSGDEDGNHPFLVEVRSPDGYLLASGETIPGTSYAPWEDEIAELFQVARNNALGVDKVYQGIAADLDLPADPDEDIPF